MCGKGGHLARDCWSRANHDKMVNEVEVEDPNAEPDKEYVYTIEHEVNVVNLSQSGCVVNKFEERKTARDWDPRTHEQTARKWGPRTHESLVMIDSGASVNVWYQKHMNKRVRTKKQTRTMMRAEKHPTSQTTRIRKWRVRRFQSQTQQRRRAQAEEKSKETQENVFVKRRLMVKSPKRPISLVPPPEDPVKRGLLKKTDMRNDELVMNVDEHLVNVVNMLTKDENMPEANSNEDNEMPKLTVLDDYGETMKGRQKELNSLKEMGTMTVVKKSEAVGKRTIQTRWVDREKDGRVKSRFVLKDYNRCQGRTQPEMFSPTPSTLSLKTMLAASSHDRNNDLESNHITVSIDVHTAFLHADVDQDLFAEPPEPEEWYDAGLKEDEVWKLNKALYGYRKAPTLWHQHLVSVLESLNYHPLLTDPSCFRNDETNTHIFVHVDDGLMFGPKNEDLKLVELLSKQVLMRITGRM